jgi:hypothetical protein
MSTDELRSNLTSAISFAHEAETFIDFVLQGRAPSYYRKGHSEYLSEETSRLAKEVDESVPDASTEATFTECRNQLDLLASELRRASLNIERPGALAETKQRIVELRKEIEQAKASL